jgi:prepilin-type N-terminal cleavage/methylation domain-containing protein
MRRTSHPRHTHSRRGFTLIELLVAITIIAILIGLLFPAIQSVYSNVRRTQIQAEVNRLATAVASFKTKYGHTPPSFVVLCEDPSDWATYPRERALIRELWPQFDFSVARNLNPDLNNPGSPTAPLDNDTTDIYRIEAGEALVFFLGGLPVRDYSSGQVQWSLRAFTKNPQNPFSLANNANRDSPSYDFETSRFSDLDNDGFPEFLDSYPSQQNPLLYFSAYDGSGYRLTEFPGGSFPASPYLNGSNENAQPHNANTFQIISPGADGQYGPCGPYIAGNSAPLPAWTRATPALTVTAQQRQIEEDNITNFSNGILSP